MKDGLLSIGTVAAQCGVSRDTIRHYERMGVISGVERNDSGYRRYAPDIIDRVRIIRRAIAIGFTIDELSRIFRQRMIGDPPCKRVRELASRKLHDVEQQIEAMQTLRNALVRVLDDWDTRLESTEEGAMAHLLESLIEPKENLS